MKNAKYENFKNTRKLNSKKAAKALINLKCLKC